MRTTIDRAGRVIIPAEIRRRLDLGPGTPLECVVDDLGLRLVRAVAVPELIRRGGRLVARPTVPEEERPLVDVTALVEEERNRLP